MAEPLLLGCDFSSAPSRRKPVVVAHGRLQGQRLALERLQTFVDLNDWQQALSAIPAWVGGFDFPFGLPRAFVESLSLGANAADVVRSVHRLYPSRMAWRAGIDAWGNTRPAGQRLLHRATDRASEGVSSTSPLQTRYVPVAFMYYEGFSRLVGAGFNVPALVPGDGQQVALEAYPGLLAHALIGRRSYKNDATAERLIARKDIVEALEQGRNPLGLRLKLSVAQAGELVADEGGDRLDAVLCLAQAAWGYLQRDNTDRPWGLAPQTDPVEGWIVSA